MLVQECDGCGCRLVNFQEVGETGIVGRHVLEHEVGIAQDDGNAVLERVLEVTWVSHGNHRSIGRELSPASPLLRPGP